MIIKLFDSTTKRIVLLVILICANTIIAQEDFNTWSAIELRYEQSKKLTFSLEGQLRMKDNVETIDQYFGQLEVQYKFPNNFRLGGAVRYIRDNDTRGAVQGYENHIRFNVDVSYKHELNRLGLKYRVRYQHRNELEISNAEGDVPRQRIRFKTTLDYNIRDWKFDPELSGELFNKFQKNGDSNGFDKYRISFGTSYKVKNIGRFSLFYRFEKEFNVVNPEKLNILSLKYTYTLK